MDPMDPDPQHCFKGRSPLLEDRCVKDTIGTKPYNRKATSRFFNRHPLGHLVEIITIVSTVFRIPGDIQNFNSAKKICSSHHLIATPHYNDRGYH